MSITLLLLINNITGCFCGRKISSKKNEGYIACCTALDTAMYSTSVMNITIVFYLLVDHKTDPLLIKNMFISWSSCIIVVGIVRVNKTYLSRLLTVDFILFSLCILFFFYFSIFRTTRVRVYQSCISHKLMA